MNPSSLITDPESPIVESRILGSTTPSADSLIKSDSRIRDSRIRDSRIRDSGSVISDEGFVALSQVNRIRIK